MLLLNVIFFSKLSVDVFHELTKLKVKQKKYIKSFVTWTSGAIERESWHKLNIKIVKKEINLNTR